MHRSEAFIKDLHHALNHLYEPDRLRENPLATIFGVDNRINTFTKLQGILIEAIEALEPAADGPAPTHAWEIYEPLFYRYVKQLTQAQVAKQLGMSVRHLRRKEHAALEVLAANLWERHNLAQKPDPVSAAPSGDGPSSPDGHEGGSLAGPSLGEELRWLRDSVPEAPTPLGATLVDTLALLTPTLEREAVSIETDLPDDLPRLAVHSVALSQSLLNLVCVGIHRATAGTVHISAQEDGASVQVDIRAMREKASLDSVALSDDDQEKLTLGAELARLSGGSLNYEQDNAHFAMVLRFPSVGRVPVLVVDDNADTLQLLRRYAIGSRYRVFTSQRPEDVHDLITEIEPAVVVLDVMMPQVDGWRLLGRVRQHPNSSALPVIVCTVLPQRDIALDLGASGFLQKPVTRQRFLAALDDQAALRV